MRDRPCKTNLALLLSGQFISQLGDKFYALALAIWVLKATGSPMQMGIMLFSSMLPGVLLGFIAGGAADRYNRKQILVAADVLRGLIVAAVIAAYSAGRLNLTVIVAAQVGLSAASAYFNPAAFAIIPQIVPEERLMKANSTSQLLAGIANIAGPALGGLAVSVLGYAFVFACNAASFFVSALLEGLVRAKPTAAAAEKARGRGSIAEGFRYIGKNRRIVALLSVVAVAHFFVGLMQVAMPVLANSLPGSGANNLGYIETASGVGVAAMALLLRAMKLKGRETAAMLAGIASIGAVMLGAGALEFLGVRAVPPYMLVFLLLSMTIVTVSVNYTVILQKSINNELAGRLFGIVGLVGNFTLPVSMLLFGCVLSAASIGVTAMICGLAVLVFCLALLLAYGKWAKPERS